jgi:hypothetical protein
MSSRAGEDDRAGRRLQKTGDQIEAGRLAGPVRTDEAQDLATPDVERDVADGGDATERLAYATHVEH